MSTFPAIFFPVKEISPFLPLWWTKVNVIRMWEVPVSGQLFDSMSVEVVFMDTQRQLVIEEGHAYEISRVVVVQYEGADRPTSHPYTLVFDMCSKVVLHERYPLISLGLSPLATIDVQRIKTERPYDTRFLVDKVGILTSVSSERQYLKDNKEVHVVFIEITDPTGKIECILHGTYVDQLDQYLKKSGPITPIIVVQLARVATTAEVVFGEYSGDAGIESVNPVTRLLFNPIIPEVFDMKKWLAINNFKLESKLKYTEIHPPFQSLSNEFLLSYPKRVIGHLNAQNDRGEFVVWGNITEVSEDDLWWYSICKDHPSTYIGSHSHGCESNCSPVPRFTIKVLVFDGKDLAYLKIHHEDVENLLQVSCDELEPDYFPYPSVFNTLVGQTMLFLVQKKTHLDTVHDGAFNVKKICVEPEIVRMFIKDEFYIEGPLVSLLAFHILY
ncbi:Nucleic acid-binding, OB-fold [Sesbania bispinosa]|nr:Nucleic acid-binding, OB-fold [Sesbania bispinosa]